VFWTFDSGRQRHNELFGQAGRKETPKVFAIRIPYWWKGALGEKEKVSSAILNRTKNTNRDPKKKKKETQTYMPDGPPPVLTTHTISGIFVNSDTPLRHPLKN